MQTNSLVPVCDVENNINEARLQLKEDKMTVTVYSTQSCPWCHRLKDWLKQNKVEFKDVDVSKDRAAAMEMIEKSGQMGVPVSDVNGEIVVGFDQATLKSLLKLK